MKRVLVIGPGGSGKSTFARRLGQILGIEVTHLDSFYWRAGWTKPSNEDWIKPVNELISGILKNLKSCQRKLHEQSHT